MESSSHNMESPIVTKTDYQLLDIDADGYCSLMDDDGNTRQDLKLPKEEEFADVRP